MADHVDHSPDFVATVSLIAALEGACESADALETLSYLGMARAELTEYGQRALTHFEDPPIISFDQALARLDQLLGDLLGDSADLATTLRIHAARETLHEAIERRAPDVEPPLVRNGSTPVASPHDNQRLGGNS